MQKLLTQGNLLDGNGRLAQAGYATKLIRKYSRDDIKAHPLRVKEWDYYYITNGDWGVCMTLDDNAYMGMLSATILNLRKPAERTKSVIVPFTRGKLRFPSSSEAGDVSMRVGKSAMMFQNDGVARRLTCHMENFSDEGKPLDIDLTLTDAPADSMVIATPFPTRPNAFYYNRKIIGMRAKGAFTLGGNRVDFQPEQSLALLDWGRGVWTYDNTWYWSAAMGMQNGHLFGFNLGYGFGDTSAATENMLFVDGTAHKLTDIDFGIPQKDGKDDLMTPWTFSSSDGRFSARFTPLINRKALTSLIVILSDQNQVFGSFTGKCTLDNGTEFAFENLPGFAEKVHNKW